MVVNCLAAILNYRIFDWGFKSRRVEAVVVYGVIFSGKAPFFSGWATGAAGHWGVIVDGLLHHLVFTMNEDRKPVGIKFKREDFEQAWIINSC